MSQICSQALLTISAEKAEKVFPAPRQITDHPDDVFELPYRTASGELGLVMMFRLSCDTWIPDPVERRAWTLQKRVIASKILAYGQTWICRSGTSIGGYGRILGPRTTNRSPGLGRTPGGHQHVV